MRMLLGGDTEDAAGESVKPFVSPHSDFGKPFESLSKKASQAHSY